jgi:hypothetical protein
MQLLGETLPQWADRNSTASVLDLQARLFGIASLLPEEIGRRHAAGSQYLRRLWDVWWRCREEFRGLAVPRELWKMSGQRPANHPHRRLALAASWLADSSLLARVEQWATRPLHPHEAPSHLLQALETPADEFWSWHWTFQSKRLAKPRPLLGAARATDLAMNVVLPWLWIRAAEGKNQALVEELQRRYHGWPPAEDNAILRLARQRLLGQSSPRSLPTAALQQGMLQIARDFCEQANSICADCQFPELVRQWGRTSLETRERGDPRETTETREPRSTRG